MEHNIGIIILNWNNYKDTKQCIQSILTEKVESGNKLDIFLIDNNSNDGSGDKLHREFNRYIKYYNTGFNGGYTAGNNFGIKKAIENSCEYILILNNDLEIRNFLSLLTSSMDVFKSDSNIGIVGFDIYNQATKDKLKSKHKSDAIFNKLLKIDDKVMAIKENLNITFERSVCGCAIFFSKKLIDTIGMFDESFFMYAEEQDICLRAIKNNFKVAKIESNLFSIYRQIDKISENQLIWYYGTRNIFYAYKNNLELKNYIIFSSIQWSIYIKKILKFYINGKEGISSKILLGLLDYFKNTKGIKIET